MCSNSLLVVFVIFVIVQMQPGATMQAMASFQQAAAAAMQTAMQGMQGSFPGVSMNTLAAAPVGSNPQQAYTDTMTAFAMQQAAAAAAGQQVGFFPGAQFMMWPTQPAPGTMSVPVHRHHQQQQQPPPPSQPASVSQQQLPQLQAQASPAPRQELQPEVQQPDSSSASFPQERSQEQPPVDSAPASVAF